MLVHLLMAVVMASVTTSSIHGRHDRHVIVDYPTVIEVDYPTANEVDYPMANEIDYPTAIEVDHTTANEVDYPTSNEVDYPTADEDDYPTSNEDEYPSGSFSSELTDVPGNLPSNPSDEVEIELNILPIPPILTDEAELMDETHVLSPTSPQLSSSDEPILRPNSDKSAMAAISEESKMKTPPNSLARNYLQDHLGGYGSDNSEENRTKYCIWYDHENEKDYELQNGTRWSGNGCKMLECKNGVITSDPSCCKIETHLNGYISTYYLYKNHGEKWIKACELLTCDSGLVRKERRIHGCCVYDHTGSKADGESWWAYSAGLKDGNFCKVGTCNNGNIEIMQIKEDGVWGNGCFDHTCKHSDFTMNRVNLPGSCNINHGGCIVNGTIEKIWPKCEGIFCINGNLFKGEMKYCSDDALILYKKYSS